jgi:hypothetical protein
MWRRVDIVLTDVSEEGIASIFRVEDKKSAREPAWAGATDYWQSVNSENLNHYWNC